ncbi:hypothetical protein GGS21DRAFT_492628 [Xylaria nigripes]|nr:hypothetical protein GGS21DRAFT_492628 [Xylaria nigripes]
MAGTKKKAPNATTVRRKKLNKFHLFTKLPKEIQLMIWRFWEENHSPIYHYLILCARGRCYAAIDSEEGRPLLSTARSASMMLDDGTPLNPFEHKIRFANRVMGNITESFMINNLISLASTKTPNQLDTDYRATSTSFSTWVNFDRDVFFLGSNYRYPGQLRFLFSGIGTRSPSALKDDHWAHRIQQLALYVSENDHLSDLDRKTLPQLKGLRKVLLVIHSPERYGRRLQMGLLWKIDDLLESRLPVSVDLYALKARVEGFRQELLHVFPRSSNRYPVTVDLMVDLTYFKEDDIWNYRIF